MEQEEQTNKQGRALKDGPVVRQLAEKQPDCREGIGTNEQMNKRSQNQKLTTEKI